MRTCCWVCLNIVVLLLVDGILKLVTINLHIHTLFRESACCTHISALLHALVAINQPYFFAVSSEDVDDEEEIVPATSLPCKWKAPKKHKESNLKISEAEFEKHVYGCEKKNKLKTLIHDLKSTVVNHQ